MSTRNSKVGIKAVKSNNAKKAELKKRKPGYL